VEESTQRMVRLNVAKCICTIITDVICTLKFISISTVTHCGDQMDHSRSLRTVISGLLSHWRHPHGGPDSHGREPLRKIWVHSALAGTRHGDELRIAYNGNKPWKRLCSNMGPALGGNQISCL